MARRIDFERITRPLALLLVLALLPFVARGENTRNVLLLHTDSRLLPAVAQYDESFLSQFLNQPQLQISVFEEFLDFDRVRGAEYEAQVSNFLSNKYKLFPIHVVVITRIPALRFILKHRDELVPNVPIVYSVVSSEELKGFELPANVYGATVDFYPDKTIELARRLHPDFKRALIITGTSPFDKEWARKIETAFEPYQAQFPLEHWRGLTSEEMISRLRKDNSGTVIFTMGMMQDGSGKRRIPRSVMKEAAEASRAPVYPFVSAGVGVGTVGTYAPRFEDMAKVAADSAVALLLEDKAALDALPKEIPSRYIIDERVLKRFDVPLTLIPENSLVLNHEPGIWEQHKNYIILAIIVFMLQTVLIGSLLVQSRHRRAAQLKLDEQLQIERKFAEVSAFLTQGSARDIHSYVFLEAALECLTKSIGMEAASFVLFPSAQSEEKIALWKFPKSLCIQPEVISDASWRSNLLTSEKWIGFENSSVAEKPVAAYYETIGVRSAYEFPVVAGGRLIGILSAYSCTRTRGLSAIVVQQLTRMAEIVANAALRVISAEAMRRSERSLALAADSARLGLWSWDPSTNEIWATDRTKAILGYSSDTPVTMEKFEARLHRDDREMVRHALADSLKTQKEYRLEYRIALPNQEERWVSACGCAIANDASQPLAMTGTLADISETKTMREKVERMRRELEHISRVNMLGELSSALAHELNQPLAAILSNAQAARRYISRNTIDLKEFTEILDDIIESDKRAGEVIRRMRLLLQKGEHSQEELNINDLVTKIVELLRADIIDKNVRLLLTLEEALPHVRAGKVEINQVLLNLMMNALEAMGSQEDGPSKRERVLHVATGTENDCVVVSVSDTGPGIPAEMRKDVFRPFFTTKATGLGMGLSICERILEVYGGRLWVEDPPDNIGARFRFCLPALPIQKGLAEK